MKRWRISRSNGGLVSLAQRLKGIFTSFLVSFVQVLQQTTSMGSVTSSETITIQCSPETKSPMVTLKTEFTTTYDPLTARMQQQLHYENLGKYPLGSQVFTTKTSPAEAVTQSNVAGAKQGYLFELIFVLLQ